MQQPVRKGRRGLSCLPCRQRKLKCSRHLPCNACTRFHRETECLKHPSPTTIGIDRAPGAPTGLSDPHQHFGEHNPVISQSSAILAQDRGSSAQLARRQSGSRKDDFGSQAHPTGLVLAREKSNFANANCTIERQDSQVCTTLPPESQGQVGLSITHQLSRIPPVTGLLKENSSPSIYEVVTTGIESALAMMDVNDSLYWKKYLAGLLPTQTQCDVLFSHFLDNLNWIHHAIHVPTFRKEYSSFWTQGIKDVDFSWLSLLFIIISVSSLKVPLEVCDFIGFKKSQMRKISHLWYRASRQALHAGDFETKPCVLHIQTFVISQIYWLATKQVEMINISVGHAIQAAQALGLDRQSFDANLIEREIRHRLWWEICHTDTFQAITLSRPPLTQSYLSTVPIPLNCNDVNMTETAVDIQPVNTPTEASFNVIKAQLFKLFNKSWKDQGSLITSYSVVTEIDSQISNLIEENSWFFRSDPNHRASNLPHLPWQHNAIHTCICMQRIRMYRQFLHPRIGNAWEICLNTISDILTVYRRIRIEDPSSGRLSRKVGTHGYQIYSVGVNLGIFLLVERCHLSAAAADKIRDDIELIIADLNAIVEGNEKSPDGLPIDIDGRKILRRILDLYDQQGKGALSQSMSSSASLVPSVFSVVGGERVARKYLEQCAIPYILDMQTTQPEKVSTRLGEMGSQDPVHQDQRPCDQEIASQGVNDGVKWIGQMFDPQWRDSDQFDMAAGWPNLNFLDWEPWEPVLFGAYNADTEMQ